MRNVKLAILIFIGLYCMYYVSSLDSWHFIDYVNLVIHEAGHVVFSLFGYFITIAGGTLLQIIVPAVFAAYYFIRQDEFSTSVLLCWLGLNFINISVYAGDALKMQLPLLTGDKDSHDWNQMLFTIGMLKHTDLIANCIFCIGVLIILFALVWGIYSLVRKNNLLIE